jgi:phosphate transport system substrate-binding protein
MVRRYRAARGVLAVWLAVLALAACGRDGSGDSGLNGALEIDGSSTVFPITQAVAEEFALANRGVRISIGVSGTGGGFEQFCRGEIAMSNASREIKPAEAEACAANGIAFTELRVALDGLSVVVHPDNDWAACLTVAQLRELWRPDSPIERWNDLDPAWPDKQIRLYGPGTDSGTFDYFTAAIVGEEDASRADYNASEDDNVLVQGVEGDTYALAYLGYAYYAEAGERLKALAIDDGNGCVAPAEATIRDGSYSPLARPLFVYVRDDALQEPTTAAFVRYYLGEGRVVIPFVGYVLFDPAVYEEQLRALPTAEG